MNSIIGRVKKQISTGGNFYELQEEVEKNIGVPDSAFRRELQEVVGRKQL